MRLPKPLLALPLKVEFTYERNGLRADNGALAAEYHRRRSS